MHEVRRNVGVLRPKRHRVVPSSFCGNVDGTCSHRARAHYYLGITRYSTYLPRYLHMSNGSQDHVHRCAASSILLSPSEYRFVAAIVMPTCRGVTITLQSQFGAQLLPEVPCSDICPLRLASPSLDLPHLPDLLLTPFDTLPAPPSSPFWQHRATIGLDNGLPAGRTTSTTNDDDRLETVDVGVKAIPGCHLWINYKCKLPATGSYPYTPQYPSPQVSRETMIIPHCRPVKYLFFRLSINDRCIQRWGTKLSSASLSESKEEQINDLGFHPGSTVLRQECNGRLMFGIFRADAKTFAVSSTGLERRAICFAKRSTRRCKAEDHRHILDPVVEADILEIQVFRSFGRTWDTVDEHSAIGASELSNDTSTNSDVIR